MTFQQDVTQNLDTKVKDMMDRRVEATEDHQRGGGLHPLVALPPLVPDGGTGDRRPPTRTKMWLKKFFGMW